MISNLSSWLNQPYFSISLWRYLAAFLIIVFVFFGKRIFEFYVLKGIKKLLSRSSFKYHQMVVDGLSRPVSAFIFVGGLYLAAMVLMGDGNSSSHTESLLRSVYLVAISVIVIWSLYRLADIFLNFIENVVEPRSPTLDKQFIPLIRKSLKALILVLGLLTILSSLHVDITSLLAGVGVAGIAVSLAAQDSLGNFFGSMALLADKPFKVGDWIIAGSKVDGFVEFIGFRSTQIRSWSNTLVTIPNKALANEVIDNWSRMRKRRVSQTIGISCETTPQQMEQLVEGVEQMLIDHPGVHQEFIMVKFTEFKESSLDLFLYYFTKSIAWKEHLQVKQEVNLNVMKIIQDLGTKLAYPVRTIYFEGESLTEKKSMIEQPEKLF